MTDEARMTVRLPKSAVDFLDAVAKDNFTSRNAEIVRSIRERMTAAAGEVFEAKAPDAASLNGTALQGGSSINHG